jgi:dGTPase
MSEKYEFLRSVSSYAKRHYSSDEDVALRSKFDRDRDRVLFSKEFRRLEGKTQVFVNGFDDHIRNRLTHTLEVSQISRTISEYFGFNTTLAEAIALAHDVGHTPFGHIGERVLSHLTNNCDPFKNIIIENIGDRGFKHNWQGLRVLCSLERISPQYKGLNLTDYTLWGVLHHSSTKYKKCDLHVDNKCSYRQNGSVCHVNNNQLHLNFYNHYSDYYSKGSWSLEGLIVNYSDEIAQRHHDIEDGLVAGIINVEELVLVFKKLFEDYLNKEQKLKLTNILKSNYHGYVLSDLSGLVLSCYMLNLINNSSIMIKDLIRKYNIIDAEGFYSVKNIIEKEDDVFKLICYENSFEEKDRVFQKYLTDRILNSHLAQSMDGKASYILKNLIEAYLSNPRQLPDNTIIYLMANYLTNNEFNKMIKSKSEKHYVGIMRDKVNDLHNSRDARFTTQLIRTITDFIAGMTDKFALTQYKILYGSDNYWGN